MTPLLLRIGTAFLLALASLIVILFRVSPLSSPALAVPFFFLTLFLTVASGMTLLLYAIWRRLSVEGMDAGKKMSVSLREGLFIAAATILLFLFQVLGILTWWIGIMIFLVFGLIEMALNS